MVHDCLLNDTKAGLADASTAMTKRINEAVDDMSESIKEQLGFESKIEIPQNFRNLFEALDFSTKYGIFDVPLQKRGDGIQARHIPHILDFIADQDSKHHIWAYEEPENSLEMSNAFNLAEQFEQKFSKENQIFLTTHSPAFYDLSSEKVSRWLVTSGQYKDTDHLTSNAIPVSVEEDNPDDRLGIAELVKERAKEIYLSHDALEKNVLRLEGEINTYTKPVVVTEGKYDVTIIKKAWEKLYPDEDMLFDITSCSAGVTDEDEQAGAKQLQTYLDSILHSESKVRIGVFDNDKAGIVCFQRLRRYKNVNALTKKHDAGKSHALLLPKPPSDELYWPTSDICIEFLFKKEYLTEGYIKRVYYGADGKEASEQQAKILDDEIDPEKLESLRSLFKQEYKIRSNRKKHFAETKVNNYPPEAFEMFAVLFDNIRAAIQS